MIVFQLDDLVGVIARCMAECSAQEPCNTLIEEMAYNLMLERFFYDDPYGDILMEEFTDLNVSEDLINGYIKPTVEAVMDQVALNANLPITFQGFDWAVTRLDSRTFKVHQKPKLISPLNAVTQPYNFN